MEDLMARSMLEDWGVQQKIYITIILKGEKSTVQRELFGKREVEQINMLLTRLFCKNKGTLV